MDKIEDLSVLRLRQLNPLLLDMQTYFLQVNALADNKNISHKELKEIGLISKHALATLDYALFAVSCMQTELPLTTLSAAAAAQDVSSSLKKLAHIYGVDLKLDMTQKLDPVFSNQSAIKGALYGLASSIITSQQPTKKKIRLVIAAQETAPTTQRIGVYSPDIQINSSTLKQARKLADTARLLAPSETQLSGLGLLVADQLAQALGCQLRRFTHRGHKGLGFYVPMSSQLSLI